MLDNIKATVKRVLEARDYIDEVEFIEMTPDEIRTEVDYTYNSDDSREVLKVRYNEDLQAYPAYVLHWLWIRPDELANSLEI